MVTLQALGLKGVDGSDLPALRDMYRLNITLGRRARCTAGLSRVCDATERSAVVDALIGADDDCYDGDAEARLAEDLLKYLNSRGRRGEVGRAPKQIA